MADSKITALTALTAADPANDMIPIVDVSDTPPASGNTKRISINNLLACSPSATLASATITGDLTVDTSTLKVAASNNRVGVNTATPESDLDVRGLIAVRGTGTFPTTGVGLEAYYSSANTSSFLQSYDRGGSAFVNLTYNALSHVFQLSSGGGMTLNATGLGVGQVPSTSKLEVGITNTSTAGLIEANSLKIENNNATVNNAAGLFLSQTGNAGCGIAGIATSRTGGSRASDLVLYYYNQASSASPIEGLRLNSTGNVGIGVTPSAWATYKAVSVGGIGASVFGLGSSQAGVAQGAFFNNGAGSGWAYSATSQVPTYYLQINGENIWNIAASGTAGAQITAWTPAMKLDANGNLILQSSATPATLATNGQLTVNATSNTNLRFSYRGSDGTTRVANITLA